MPSLQSFDVLLVLTNDLNDCVSVQLLRDYHGRHTHPVILLKPTESLTLVLEAGSSYQYAIRRRNKVAGITARSWRDITCHISTVFTTGVSSESISSGVPATLGGVSVDRLWRDHRLMMWTES